MPRNRVLLFGATGALGGAISETYKNHGWQIFRVVRQSAGLADEVLHPLEDSKEFENAIATNKFDSIVFAQGVNMNGSVMTTEEEDFHRILVNGALPGVVDTPMSRKGLNPNQIADVVNTTRIETLVTPTDVGNTVFLLGSELNTGVSGQSLLVDQFHKP